MSKNDLWVMSLPEALTRVSPSFFTTHPIDAEVALRMVRDPSQLLRPLLEQGGTTRASRLAGAYSFWREPALVEQITQSMKAAGHSIRPENPFERPIPSLSSGLRIVSPYVARVMCRFRKTRFWIAWKLCFNCFRMSQMPVRAVLGHFFFVYIHPYHNGNGRPGRFLMNAMLASGGFPWTVIRLSRRSEYMAALDQASGDSDIGLLAQFIREEMEAGDRAS